MNADLPPALDDLGDQLHDAAARDNEVEARVAQRVRRGHRRHWLALSVAALVSFGGVAVAERALDRRGADIAPDELPAEIAPAAGSGIVASSATPDPGGGPPWALRVFTNPAGLDCVALGRLVGGALGRFDADRTFHRFPDRVSGTCEPLARRGLLAAVQYRAVAPRRTIVFGLSRDRRPVRVTIAGVTRTVAPGGLGTFVDVREGIAEMHKADVTTTDGNGRTIRRALG